MYSYLFLYLETVSADFSLPPTVNGFQHQKTALEVTCDILGIAQKLECNRRLVPSYTVLRSFPRR